MMRTQEILPKLKKVKTTSDGWMACCPSHDDNTPSLSIKEADNGNTLLKCHAGCDTSEIVSALGIKESDLFKDKPSSGQKERVAEYTYKDAEGKTIFRKVRFSNKGFVIEHPVGSEWKSGMNGQAPVLYRLPDWKNEKTVFFVEGEKDADNLTEHLPATTNPFGAGKWKVTYTPYFKDKTVYIIADNDKPGTEHAELVATNIYGVATSVKILQFTEQAKGYDVSDWIKDNPEDTWETLLALFEDVPSWQPKRRFARHTLSTLKAHKVNPQDFIAGDGWLRREAACLLTGGTGMGKSVLTAQIAASVASGEDILGRIKVPKPRKVLVIQAENDEDTMKRDYESVVDQLDANPELIEANLVMLNVYGVSGTEFANVLEEAVKAEQPDLIIVDPYQAYIGGVDINGTQSFLTWIEPVDRIYRAHRCALLLVAHTPKPRDRSDRNAIENVYMAAGTSALANYVRTSCELVTVGKETQRYKLTFGKNPQRTGLYDERFGRVLREMYIEHSPEATKPCWTISEDQTTPTRSQYDDKIKTYVEQHPKASLSEIGGVVGCSKGNVSKRRKALGI